MPYRCVCNTPYFSIDGFVEAAQRVLQEWVKTVENMPQADESKRRARASVEALAGPLAGNIACPA